MKTYLIVTIDVEEDNWGNYEIATPSISNVKELLNFQKLCDRYGIKPTYLITYPVATDRESVNILRKILDDGKCEIAAHLHPWNTPPFEEEKNSRNSMLCNLPRELQYKKIENLHAQIYENLKLEPVSFRSGRWACDRNVAENINRFNYKIDTSVTPFIDWSRCKGPDYSECPPIVYKYFFGDRRGNDSYILEVPATIGFRQTNYRNCNRIFNILGKKWLRSLRLQGIFDKLQIINKIWLSPEFSDGEKMIELANSMRRNGYSFLNMFFHSPDLVEGMTPFVKTKEGKMEFLARIEKFFEYSSASNIQAITLSETLNYFDKQNNYGEINL